MWENVQLLKINCNFFSKKNSHVILSTGHDHSNSSSLLLRLLLSVFWMLAILIYVQWCKAAAAKSLQSCPTLCDPTDGSPPGSPVPGILQTRTMEWVAISFSNAWKWKVKVKLLSCVWPSATPWTTAYQASLSMEFSRQEYWIGVPLPSLKLTLYLNKSERKHWKKKVTIRVGIIFVVNTSGAEENHLVHSPWAVGCMGSVAVVPRL